MSASKGAWSPASGAGAAGSGSSRGGGRGRLWQDYTPRHRCPICGHDGWCGEGRGPFAGWVMCHRVGEAAREKISRDGTTYWIHRDPAAPPLERSARLPALPPSPERANLDVRHRAYAAVLAALRLEEPDVAGLAQRGFTAETAFAAGFRTLPKGRRYELARVVVDAVGEEAARQVPGIVQRSEDGRTWLRLDGYEGLVFGVRGLDGLIRALKVRRRDVDGPARYRWVTSSYVDGPSAEAAVHVPTAALALRERAEYLGIVEGELKAETCTALLGQPFISIPGVGFWRAGLDAALAFGAPRFRIAMDMDRHKPEVARAQCGLVEGLFHEGVAVDDVEWPASFKGYDDFQLARLARAQVTGPTRSRP